MSACLYSFQSGVGGASKRMEEEEEIVFFRESEGGGREREGRKEEEEWRDGVRESSTKVGLSRRPSIRCCLFR